MKRQHIYSICKKFLDLPDLNASQNKEDSFNERADLSYLGGNISGNVAAMNVS